ncbi:hypothetical protein ONE63_011375 [Megalurothrips usitatus]|uniref:Integrase catalytic domain-containing protein n=1 Tax=Megalurothrips usitatus TaxID=439358 RepID=A0AAV7WZE9_9NEOP|nr:hypothetical protein ONE63_011375 [Megalurothrips usitatus]
MQATLRRVYYDIGHPAGYGSVQKLWEAVGKRISKERVREFLRAQDAYTLNRRIRRKFPRNRVYVDNIDQIWQTDLLCLPALKKYNDQHVYVLVVIDCFSKMCWLAPLRTKSADDVTAGFRQIFEATDRRPQSISSDSGKEYCNRKLGTYLKSLGIHHFKARDPEMKCSIAERLIRTLREKLWKMFTAKGSYRYIDQLPALANSYNRARHRSIGMAPEDVGPENVLQVYNRLYRFPERTVPARLKVGDTVRIAKEKARFEKGAETGWTTETFVINAVYKRAQPCYSIVDWRGQEIEGLFYSHELQLVKKPTHNRVQYIVQTKGKGRSRRHLVRWEGYGPEADQWVKESDLVRL